MDVIEKCLAALQGGSVPCLVGESAVGLQWSFLCGGTDGLLGCVAVVAQQKVIDSEPESVHLVGPGFVN